MYLVAIAWLYVALMMAVAEATHPVGTALGAIITFFLYGVGPLALVLYIMGAPARRKAIKAREQAGFDNQPAAMPRAHPASPPTAASRDQPKANQAASATTGNNVTGPVPEET